MSQISAAQAMIEAIFDRAMEAGDALSEKTDEYAERAIEASEGGLFGPRNASGTGVNARPVTEPNVFIPNKAAGIDSELYQTTYKQIKDDISGQFKGFFETYFPNECDYLAKAQLALCNMLDGKTGIPAEVEDQIWQRDRARVLNEVGRSHREVLASFAGRGFPLPPGAAQHQLSALQRDAQDKVAQQSREVAIKHLELLIENVRFAIGQALDYRIKGIAAAGDYIKTLAFGPDIAMKLATSSADAQTKLISAVSQFYNARIAVSDLYLRAGIATGQNWTEASKLNAQLDVQHMISQAQIIAELAKAAGTRAAAALNAVHASSGMSVSGDID